MAKNKIRTDANALERGPVTRGSYNVAGRLRLLEPRSKIAGKRANELLAGLLTEGLVELNFQ